VPFNLCGYLGLEVWKIKSHEGRGAKTRWIFPARLDERHGLTCFALRLKSVELDDGNAGKKRLGRMAWDRALMGTADAERAPF
jgi:hypothetical protein